MFYINIIFPRVYQTLFLFVVSDRSMLDPSSSSSSSSEAECDEDDAGSLGGDSDSEVGDEAGLEGLEGNCL